jgi:hypothetical protein
LPLSLITDLTRSTCLSINVCCRAIIDLLCLDSTLSYRHKKYWVINVYKCLFPSLSRLHTVLQTQKVVSHYVCYRAIIDLLCLKTPHCPIEIKELSHYVCFWAIRDLLCLD